MKSIITLKSLPKANSSRADQDRIFDSVLNPTHVQHPTDYNQQKQPVLSILMVDRYANYIIQRMLELGQSTQNPKNELLKNKLRSQVPIE